MKLHQLIQSGWGGTLVYCKQNIRQEFKTLLFTWSGSFANSLFPDFSLSQRLPLRSHLVLAPAKNLQLLTHQIVQPLDKPRLDIETADSPWGRATERGSLHPCRRKGNQGSSAETMPSHGPKQQEREWRAENPEETRSNKSILGNTF